MNHRELVLLLAGAMTTARALRAQQKALPVESRQREHGDVISCSLC